MSKTIDEGRVNARRRTIYLAAVAALASLVAGCRDGQHAIPDGPKSVSGEARQAGRAAQPEQPGAGADVSSEQKPSAEPDGPSAAAVPPGPRASAPPKPPNVTILRQDLTDVRLEKLILNGVFKPDVVEVRLTSNKLSARSLELLATSPIKKLEVLDISDNPVGDDGARVIAREPFFQSVNDLSIGMSGMTLEGLRALLGKDSKLASLYALSVIGTAIGDEGIEVLLASRVAPQIHTLAVSNSGLTRAGVRALLGERAKPSRLEKLSRLSVDRTPLGDEGVAALLASPFASKLRFLSLAEVGMTDAGAKQLAASEALSDLEFLNLARNQLTEEAFAALRQSPHLRGCRVLVQ